MLLPCLLVSAAAEKFEENVIDVESETEAQFTEWKRQKAERVAMRERERARYLAIPLEKRLADAAWFADIDVQTAKARKAAARLVPQMDRDLENLPVKIADRIMEERTVQRFTQPTARPAPHVVKPVRELSALNAAELIERIVVPMDYLPLLGQPGYIVKGGTHLLAAYPKAGKTELMTACIRDWVQAGLSVVIFSEESGRIWTLRLKKLSHSEGLTNLTIVPALGATTADMMKLLDDRAPDVIIIDTLRSMLGVVDENDSAQMARGVEPWTEYSQRTGSTLIVLHHTRKSGGEHGEGVSGGHGLTASLDITLEMKRDGADNRRSIEVRGRLIEAQKGIYERTEIMTSHGLGSGSYEMHWLGEKFAVTLDAVQERIELLLIREPQTASDIHESLDDPRPSLRQVQRALLEMAGAVPPRALRSPAVGEDVVSGRAIKWRRA